MEPLSLKVSLGVNEDEMESTRSSTETSFASLPSSRDSLELPADMNDWSKEEFAAYTALRSKRKKCCVGGCTHKSLPIARSYHQLPVRNKDVWEKWIEVIRWSRNEPEWIPSGDAAPLVCSRHFADSDFISYEASSRVRLSHTALPVYFVDPPEGTVMDAKFDKPIPMPMMIPVPKHKEPNKPKPACSNRDAIVTIAKPPRKRKVGVYPVPPPQLVERVTEENYDSPNGFSYLLQQLQAQSLVNSVNKPMTQNNVHSSAAFAPNNARHRKPKSANSLSKPPALIRAFPSNTEVSIRPNLKQLPQQLVQSNPFKANFGGSLSSPLIVQHKSQPSKHKLGLAKCRHIVQTVEKELKLVKLRLAGELDIPYQVVNGVWNMRDSLKDKL